MPHSGKGVSGSEDLSLTKLLIILKTYEITFLLEFLVWKWLQSGQNNHHREEEISKAFLSKMEAH